MLCLVGDHGLIFLSISAALLHFRLGYCLVAGGLKVILPLFSLLYLLDRKEVLTGRTENACLSASSGLSSTLKTKF